jgi:ribosomal 50S subunit-recycling heat shock protein
MRIDSFLKITGVFKSREQARKACRNSFVYLNGVVAKPSAEVKIGDMIELKLPTREAKIKVIGIPPKNVPKKKRHLFVGIIEDKHIKPHESEGFWESLPGNEL